MRPSAYHDIPDPKPTAEEVLAAMWLNIYFMRKYMFIPGRIENMCMISDMSGELAPFGVFRPNMQKIPIVNRGRMRTVFMVNGPSTINFIWKVVSFFLDENSCHKFQISRQNSCPDMVKLIAPEQLEEKYGGTAPNR